MQYAYVNHRNNRQFHAGMTNSQHQQQQQQQQQQRVRAPPQPMPTAQLLPPSKQQLTCEPCARTFNSMADLHAHLRSHRPCCVDGCSFAASARALKEHYAEVHRLSPDGVTPLPPEPPRMPVPPPTPAERADVERYIAERKRNFPTAANVERKARGDAQATADGRPDKKAQSNGGDESARERRRRLTEVLKKQRELGLCKLAGTEALAASTLRRQHKDEPAPKRAKKERRKEVEEAKKEKEIVVAKQPSAVCDSLALVNAYASSSSGAEEDEKDEEDEALSTSSGTSSGESEEDSEDDAVPKDGGGQQRQHQQRARAPPCRFFLRGHCRKGSACSFLHERPTAASSVQATPARPATLLEKLLRREVRRERGWILQAVRFFTHNTEYFEHQVGGEYTTDMTATTVKPS